MAPVSVLHFSSYHVGPDQRQAQPVMVETFSNFPAHFLLIAFEITRGLLRDTPWSWRITVCPPTQTVSEVTSIFTKPDIAPSWPSMRRMCGGIRRSSSNGWLAGVVWWWLSQYGVLLLAS